MHSCCRENLQNFIPEQCMPALFAFFAFSSHLLSRFHTQTVLSLATCKRLLPLFWYGTAPAWPNSRPNGQPCCLRIAAAADDCSSRLVACRFLQLVSSSSSKSRVRGMTRARLASCCVDQAPAAAAAPPVLLTASVGRSVGVTFTNAEVSEAGEWAALAVLTLGPVVPVSDFLPQVP